MLLDEIALEGVRFPSALFLFRKVLFTLDGVLHDVAGRDVRIDEVILREFLARAVASFGLFHPPLKSADFITIQREVLWYPVRRWVRLASREYSKSQPFPVGSRGELGVF